MIRASTGIKVMMKLRRTPVLMIGACIATAACAVLSLMQLSSDWNVKRAIGLLDDRETSYRDIVEPSDQSIARYRKALERLNRAAVFMPISSAPHAGLAELNMRLGVWTDTMRYLSKESAVKMPENADYIRASVGQYRSAIRWTPTSAAMHLSLGRLYRMIGEVDAAEEELERAAYAYPLNSPTRYAVALEYMLARNWKRAGKHARMLLRNDDGFLVQDASRRSMMIELNRPEYERRLIAGYPYRAYEIIWRSSGKDVEAIWSSIPDYEEARDAARVFLYRNGAEMPVEGDGTSAGR